MLIGVLKDRPITGNDPKAYDCMVPIDELLKTITPCFQRSPQKYVAICGPVQSGKSTVLNLVKQSLESQASPTKVIVVDLSYCREHESLEELLDRIKSAFQVVVDDILQQNEGSADSAYLNFNIDIWKSEQNAFSIINQLMSILPSELKILLALENVDLKEESGIWDLLSELRKIHDKRNLDPLKRFSVLTTSTASLTIPHGEISSPYNCAEEYHIEDCNEKTLRAFLNRVASHNECEFDPKGIDLLLSYFTGTLNLLQDVLSRIQKVQFVSYEIVANGIAEAIENSSRFSDYAINHARFSKEAEDAIGELLQNKPKIRYESDKGYRELRRRGLVTKNAHNWVVFRSKILSFFAANRFINLKIKGLSVQESVIADLPQIKLACVDAVYIGKVISTFNEKTRNEGTKTKSNTIKPLLSEIIQECSPPVDYEFAQTTLKRYWDEKRLGAFPTQSAFSENVKNIISSHIIWMLSR